MAIIVSWLDQEQAIVVLSFKKQWTWEEVIAALKEADEMISTVSKKAIIIYDLLESNFLPQKILGSAKAVYDVLPKHVEINILITNNNFIKTMNSLVLRTFPKFLAQSADITVETWDEALAAIKKRRGQ
jgi:hypothetical protein